MFIRYIFLKIIFGASEGGTQVKKYLRGSTLVEKDWEPLLSVPLSTILPLLNPW